MFKEKSKTELEYKAATLLDMIENKSKEARIKRKRANSNKIPEDRKYVLSKRELKAKVSRILNKVRRNMLNKEPVL